MKRTKKPAAPPFLPLPTVADQLRKLADQADVGAIQGLALCAMLETGVATNIVDPTGAHRLTLAGAVAQLHHMLQASEHNDRMSSLARRADPGPQT